MESASQDRNLPATQRKLQKAREDGQVHRSEDLSRLAALGVGALAIVLLAPQLLELLRQDMGRQLHFDAALLRSAHTLLPRLGDAMVLGLGGSVVFGTLVGAATVLASIASGGWVLSLTPVMPDLSRLNPLSGLSNLLSRKKLLGTAKMLLLTALLFVVATLFLRNGLVPVASLLLQPSAAALAQLVQWLTGGMGLLLLVLLLAALVDVPLQKFLHMNELKMSHQELKQEHKESDGNPQVRQRQKQKQRELAQRASVTAVPKADFVVMNPTHYAVAIRYDERSMHAPQVISKGSDLLALKIRDIAKQHAIPVLQSPMLARALYTNAELDRDIPSALYAAVAQVLAYVYRLRAALKGQGPMPGDMPQPLVPPELDPHHTRSKASAP